MSNCPTMPFAVRDTVFQRLGKSRVDVNVSRNPNGNIDGIHPVYTHISFDQDMLGGGGGVRSSTTHLAQAPKPSP